MYEHLLHSWMIKTKKKNHNDFHLFLYYMFCDRNDRINFFSTIRLKTTLQITHISRQMSKQLREQNKKQKTKKQKNKKHSRFIIFSYQQDWNLRNLLY